MVNSSTKPVFLSATTLAIVSVLLGLGVFRALRPGVIPGARDTLHGSEVIQLVNGFGPESMAFDANGEGPYTGVGDGRILKWQGDGHGWVEFAVTSPAQRKNCGHPSAPAMEHICGRPLGLRFHKKTGDLYIADAYFGLLMVGPNGGLATQVITEAENQPFLFTNDLDIDEDQNIIYFTDSSTIFQRRQFMSAFLSSDNTGRLVKYNIATKEVKVLMRGLTFPNGVALEKDHSFVLVAETLNCKILRYWLQGPKAGTWDIFADLPGFPDNIRRSPKGDYWVALHSKKGLATNWALKNPWLGKVLLKLPLGLRQLHYLLVGGKAHACIVRVSEEGEVVEVLEDSLGKSVRFVSEVEERNGELWIGSVLMNFVGRYKLVGGVEP